MKLCCPICLKKLDSDYYFSCASGEYPIHHFHGVIDPKLKFFVELIINMKSITLFSGDNRQSITLNKIETNIDAFEPCQSLDIISKFLNLKSFL